MNVNIKGLEPRMKVEYKEQKIRDALSRYFSDGELNNIMSYWKKKYSKQPAFVLRRFIDDICVRDNHKSLKSNMIKDILVAFNQADTTEEDVSISITQKCFESYVNDVLDILPETSADAFINAVETRLLSHTSNLHVTEKAVFEKHAFQIITFLKADKLNRHTQHIQAVLYLPFLQTVAAIMYRAICHVVGPIDADDITKLAFERRYAEGQENEIHQITQI